VLQKASERVEMLARKNPAVDLEDFGELKKFLQYCDLRELQDTILSSIPSALIEQPQLQKNETCRICRQRSGRLCTPVNYRQRRHDPYL
jgi:hypothetical protein